MSSQTTHNIIIFVFVTAKNKYRLKFFCILSPSRSFSPRIFLNQKIKHIHAISVSYFLLFCLIKYPGNLFFCKNEEEPSDRNKIRNHAKL